MCEREHEVADFYGEWVILPVASRAHPEDLSCRTGCCQRVQHGQNRRRSDPCTEQQHRTLSRLQNEASARRADVESIAYPEMVSQVDSSRAIRLDLHADSITFRRSWTRERVAAKECRAAGNGLKTHNNVLAWQSVCQLAAVRALHRQREDVRGLMTDRRYCKRPKSGCDRMCGGWHEPGIATGCDSALALQ